MDVQPTPLEGVLLIKPVFYTDSRGYFLETWQERRYTQAGLTLPFVQDNQSLSSYGVLRGIHFQKEHPQGKLVSVSLGSVYDVAVDIRKGSATFGQWYGVELTHENHWQLWVPPGLAHGFVVTSETALFQYKVTEFYRPEDEDCIIWNDPRLNINWPVKNPILSAKDAAASGFDRITDELRP